LITTESLHLTWNKMKTKKKKLFFSEFNREATGCFRGSSQRFELSSDWNSNCEPFRFQPKIETFSKLRRFKLQQQPVEGKIKAIPTSRPESISDDESSKRKKLFRSKENEEVKRTNTSPFFASTTASPRSEIWGKDLAATKWEQQATELPERMPKLQLWFVGWLWKRKRR
jgi:hypothetical protein